MKSKKYNFIKKCRMCHSKNLIEYLDLGMQPLANSFISKNQFKNENIYPLKLILCKSCGLSSLSVVVNPKIIFDSYDYLSSSSKALQSHYNKLTSNIIKKFKIKNSDILMDIGCNDGILLNQYGNKYKNLYGVEPSNASKNILNTKIRIFKEFFNINFSKKYINNFKPPKIITITNVFAHINNLDDFTKALKVITNTDSIIIIEFPYLPYMIEKKTYDIIYHEHLSYISLTPLKKFFNKYSFKIFNVEKINFGASGPSLRVFVSKSKSKFKINKSVNKILIYEKKWGIKKISNYKNFSQNVILHKNKLKNLIQNIYKKGSNIGCFSAPAKGNTLLNYLNLDKNIISYVSENNKRKLGKYTPGTHIKIINDNEFFNKNIYYVILLSWNYSKYFVSKKIFSKKKIKLIIPFPNIKIIK